MSEACKKGKYNPETVAIITDHLSRGCTKGMAHKAAGVREATFYQWLKEKPEFAEACKEAENSLICDMVNVVYEQAKKGNFQAAKFLLEKHGGAEWTKTVEPYLPDDEIQDFSVEPLVTACEKS